MPVDETILEAKRVAVNAKLNATRGTLHQLKEILRNINSIQMVQDPLTPNDPTKQVKPKDRGVNDTMTDSRRQKVYDQVLVDSDSHGL